MTTELDSLHMLIYIYANCFQKGHKYSVSTWFSGQKTAKSVKFVDECSAVCESVCVCMSESVRVWVCVIMVNFFDVTVKLKQRWPPAELRPVKLKATPEAANMLTCYQSHTVTFKSSSSSHQRTFTEDAANMHSRNVAAIFERSAATF